MTPGDVVVLECTLTKRRGPVGVGEAKATVDGRWSPQRELTFAIGG